MPVNISWVDAQVQSDASIRSKLSPQIIETIVNKTGNEYLDILAFASLIPSCTDRLFTLYEPLIVEITARWLSRNVSGDLAADIAIFSVLARILPLAPYLKPRLLALLASSRGLKALRRTGELNLVTLSDEQLISVLLACFRLLTYDVGSFAFVISPLQLSSICAHTDLSIRCLAIHCMNLQMGMSDALSHNVLANHVPDGLCTATWEGTLIDYRWLKLFEEKRWDRLKHELCHIRSARPILNLLAQKGLTLEMWSSETCQLGNVLIPRSGMPPDSSTDFVHTLTTTENLQSIGQALLDSYPLLLSGKAGSGKTSLINEAAAQLNKASSMVTLYLNEQTDAKSLIGVYTTVAAGGSFVWQPGVLTRAMREGRWVVIEDIDRAPSEVVGVLLPIIQKGSLRLPNRREQVQAADGFRVFATMRRSDDSVISQEHLPRSLLDSTHWRHIHVQELTEEETATFLQEKFPLIGSHIGMILRVAYRVKREYEHNPALRNLRLEATSLRKLLRWCHRINSRLRSFGKANIPNGIPESVQDDTFMDALDCFVAHLPTQRARLVLGECIAEEMHIAPRRRDYCFRDRTPPFHESVMEVKLGRVSFPRIANGKRTTATAATNQPFASTRHALKVMESMLAALMLSEPLLLVGETGIGKTAFVQRLARSVNQKLTVINLSQQSESSDILGGFKPITTRSLALPLVEMFNDLFDDTFSAERNRSFRLSVNRCVAKQNWHRLLLLFQEATKKAQQKFDIKSSPTTPDAIDEQPTKRRRLVLSMDRGLRQRWTDFSTKMEAFSVQASRGDKNFAFAFVEGKIVDAVRNGEWILFDEINLASPDTLDSIATLLRSGEEGLPHLLLPEAGNLERVMAHSSLRIIAAMNPATDFGKKDLAPGLRARFTELFVPSPDDDLHDLITLNKTYLGPLLDIDERAASDLARLYLQVKKLNDENRLTDGAGDRPHFSIRSLVRCLMYVVQNTPTYGLRRAMYEGAAMSYLTVLSSESARTILPLLDECILLPVKNAQSVLNQMRKTPPAGQFVRFKHHWLQQGPLAPQQRSRYIITPFVERNLLNLARATSMKRFPVLLQGPTSSGKTSMVEYLARVSGHHFVRINNHEHTDLQEYLGFYASDDTGKLQYKEGVLVQALREGHWIVLDELNLAPTDVLEALNRLLDDNRELFVPESQEVVKPHPSFMLFATQNPAGAYGGRKRLSRAFRNRFLEIHFDDIPEDELETILRERTQIAPPFCRKIVSVYKRLALLRQSTRLFEQRNSFVTLRDLFRWALRKADDWQQLANNGFMLLAERVRDPAERRAVKLTIEDELKVKINEVMLYDTYPEPELSGTSDTVVWTRAMKRLFALVSEAIAHNEPVLLIGETGCGKTQVCQTIASAAGQCLRIYNAHANTETGDLIGAQRPTRRKAETDCQLRENIQELLNMSAQQVNDAGFPLRLDELIENLDKADTSNADPAFLGLIRRQIAHRASLFQWMDGSLVRAMKDGDHFLLDEISLAEDSVLERLNSLLEPERTLLLAEKGPSDSSIVAAPGFQFMATMNPSGDYGKRELSGALRNRFTEIWVPPLTDEEDILPIVRSRLQSTMTNAAEVMTQFAKWFKATFENSATTSSSLRSLLSWSDFVRANKHLTSYESMVHGAAMVYIDTLGANPSGMLNMNLGNIHAARERCLEKLGELLLYDTSSIYHHPVGLEIGASLQIGCFRIDANPDSAISQDIVFDAPTTLQNGMRVVRALQVSKAILLEGNPGSGKTALVTALARVAGKRLVRINLSDQTDLMDLFGADVPTEGGAAGSFSWHDGPMLQAMQSGAWVLLDEMNLASQSILEGLNSCLDHRQEVYIAELDRTFQRHPGFMLFAAQNPHQKGGGRKGLPASFVNRFTIVYTEDFKMEDLTIICQRIFPTIPPSDLRNVLTTFFEVQTGLSRNRHLQNVGGPWDMNLRDINRWLQLSTQDACDGSPLQYLDIIIGRRLRTSDQRAVYGELANVQPSQYAHRPLYHNLTLDSYRVGSAFLNRKTAIVHSSYQEGELAPEDLPTMEALMLCVARGWPGILVGPADCGKSALLRKLAATIGSTLVELPMNADTDIMDLIGGFEQYDPQRSLSALRQKLCYLVHDHICQLCLKSLTGRSWDLIVGLYERLVIRGEDLEAIRPLLVALSNESVILAAYLTQFDASLGQDSSTRMKFQWIDGALVEAVEQGHWVVLENANLCGASVLDRLNSLLEPDGSLIISEQHNLDGYPRLLRPHKDFRIFLTMDPRNGELSPAMRNRSLEIYMEKGVLDESGPHALMYSTTSALSRMRLLTKADLKNVPAEVRSHISRICLGHLSLQEHMSSLHWQASLLQLLSTEDVEHITYCQSLPPDLITQIRDFYTLLSSTGTLGKGDVIHQPIKPILNQYILRDENVGPALSLAWLTDSFITLAAMRKQLKHAGARAENLKRSEMTVLEASFYAGTATTDHVRKPQRIAPALELLGNVIYGFLHESLRLPILSAFDTKGNRNQRLTASINARAMCSYSLYLPWARCRAFLESLLHYLLDFIHLTSHFQLEAGVLQVYIQIGQKLILDMQSELPKLSEGLSNVLALLEQNYPLRYGRSLLRMWDLWRPVTASTPAHLEQLRALEAMAFRFDELILRVPRWATSYAEVRTKLLLAWEEALGAEMETTALVRDLETAVEHMQSQQPGSESLSYSFYSNEFECFCQIHDLHDDNASWSFLAARNRDAILLIKAGRKTRLHEKSPINSPVPGLLSKIARFAGSESSAAGSCAWRQTSIINLILKVSICQYQPLGSQHSLTEDTTFMIDIVSSLSQAISSSHALRLKEEVALLLQQILNAHSDLFAPRFDPTQALSQLSEASEALFGDQISADHYFRAITSSLLQPAAVDLAQDNVNEEDRLIQVGAALFRVCIALLYLLVPDQPLDPALSIAVQRDRYDKRLRELHVKLEALQTFERSFSGLSKTMEMGMIEDEILALGERPPSPCVARPRETQLPLLAAEFSNLISSTVKAAGSILIRDQAEANADELAIENRRREAYLFQQNNARTVQRLSNSYRAYADLTTPVIRTIQCLNLAVDLVMLHDRPVRDVDELIGYVSTHTPFLGATPVALTGPRFAPRFLEHCTTNTKLQWLDHFALNYKYSCRVQDDDRNDQELLTIMDQFYQEWKMRLTKDQQLEARKSKYYSYRGGDQDDEATLEMEIQELFPSFLGDSDSGKASIEEPAYEPKMVALKLDKLLRVVNSNAQLQDLEEVVFAGLGLLHGVVKQDQIDFSSISPGSMLPGAMLLIHQRWERPSYSGSSKTFNIYTDTNAEEARRISEIAKKIKRRIEEILATWPEHALLHDICVCCTEVFQFKICDPLAKILTKAEKLHQIASEWQAVASREFSVALLLDQLTKVIVSWRKLELESWSGLLDLEMQKVKDDARSWFFVAYEVVVAIPFRLLTADESVEQHVEELVMTLESFLKNAASGQFTERLQLIEGLSSLVSRFVTRYPALLKLTSSITNLLQHHNRYREAVESSLRTGRAKLEKDLKEQIKLASWKDTNVSALRESARRSHHKLFKIIRKYRTLLLQPIKEDVGGNSSTELSETSPSLTEVRAWTLPSAASRALERCQQEVLGWQSRPIRLRDALGAAAIMRQHYLSRVPTTFSPHRAVNSMVSDLSETVKELKSLTPARHTEDNRDLVQHLKTRKRRFLADVLKGLRHMGLQRNPSLDQLSEQRSTALLLSTIPPITSNGDFAEAKLADDLFHGFLDFMPQIRAALETHSDELTASEVTRCVGLAEGMLLVLRKQRASLSPALASLERFQTVLQRVTTLQRDESDPIATATYARSSDSKSLMQKLHWLPDVLDLGCKILEIQAQHTKLDLSLVTDIMRSRSNALRSLYLKLRKESMLFPGLSTKFVVATSRNAHEMIAGLRGELFALMEQLPQTAYVLKQVLWWTEHQANDTSLYNGETRSHSIADVDRTIREAVDKIFVALQDTTVVQSNTAVRSSKDMAWLTSSSATAASSVKALRIEKVVVPLETAFDHIRLIDDANITLATSLFIVVTPIIEQYYHVCHQALKELAMLHYESCRYANVLAKAFRTISSEGFCSPVDDATGRDEQSGQIEQGTGLGEGEGAEDISKDVGETEDLSELAQAANSETRQNEMDDVEDAVDVADGDLDGSADDLGENREGQKEGEENDEVEEDGDLDDETGSVDDLDPSAVNEKLWDDLHDENKKELNHENNIGQASEEQAAKNEKHNPKQTDALKDEGEKDNGENEGSAVEEAEEDGAPGPQESNQLDPTAPEEETLGLPEDMQLDGEKTTNNDLVSDDDVEDLSENENTEEAQMPPELDQHPEDDDGDEPATMDADIYGSEQDNTDAEEHASTEPTEDQVAAEAESETDAGEEDNNHMTSYDDDLKNAEDTIGEDTGTGGHANEDATNQEQNPTAGQAQQPHVGADQHMLEGAGAEGMNGGAQDEVSGKRSEGSEVLRDLQTEGFKKLGDILDQWHRRRDIGKPSQNLPEHAAPADANVADADLEHVGDDADHGDTQALDAATKDQATALDQSKAFMDNEVYLDEDHHMPDIDEDENDIQNTQDQVRNEKSRDLGEQRESGEERSFDNSMGELQISEKQPEEGIPSQDMLESEDLQDVDEQFSAFQLNSLPTIPLVSLEEASRLWTHYSSATHSLSLLLTEQLRLILAPTLATKLRGDFRTGKRLNIKRIIPYIASGYKRDKIWMRRSVPSKRNYQIMVAVDNSKSMMEGGAAALALESLALLCKSLSMLEVGEICVVGFGDEEHVRVAQPFTQNFTSDSGPRIFGHLSFQQTATDVRKLVAESISLFREARAKSARASADLWQLELIISDGICEDHETIRRLVRQAAEERIMIVFVIVDSAAAGGSSILDLQKASYEPDSGGGEPKLTVRRYLEGFPFPYYLIVRDVRDLPGVLANALKGWFAEVVDVQG